MLALVPRILDESSFTNSYCSGNFGHSYFNMIAIFCEWGLSWIQLFDVCQQQAVQEKVTSIQVLGGIIIIFIVIIISINLNLKFLVEVL